MTSTLLKSLVFATLFTSAASFNGIALAQDPVVAKVNGTEIHQSEVDEFKKIFPPQLIEEATKRDPKNFNLTLVRQLADLKLVIQEAKNSGLENTPEVKKALETMKENILFKAFLSEKLKNAVTDEAIQKKYEEERKNIPKDALETRARHILVKDEKTAKDIIKKLDEGADFMKLARQYSVDKASAQEGGDLGFFMKEDFIPAFTEVAFKIEPGKYAKEPVKTDVGYHVVKVDERRRAKPKTLEQEKERIQGLLVEKATTDLMKSLRAKAEVLIFDEKGQPIKDAANDASASASSSSTKKAG